MKEVQQAKDRQKEQQTADNAFLSHAKEAIASFKEDLQEFSDFDSTLNQTLLESLEELVALVENIPTAEDIENQKSGFHEKIDGAYKTAQSQIKKIHYFVKKAAKEDATLLQKFGFEMNTAPKPANEKMLSYLRQLYEASKDNSEALLSVGCHENQIEKILEVCDNLEQTDQAKYMFGANQSILAEQRAKYVFQLRQQIGQMKEAAMLIYEDDLERLQSFLQARRLNNAENKKSEIEIGAFKTQPVITASINSESILRIDNTGPTSIKFCVSGTSLTQFPANAEEIFPGKSGTLPAAKISDGTYGILVARNEGGMDGKFGVWVLE